MLLNPQQPCYATPMPTPARTPSEILREQLPEVRASVSDPRQRLTVRGFAAQLAEDGMPLDPSIISRIEQGKRGVSLDEALAFAYSLSVTPTRLFLPVGRSSPVTVIGKRSFSPRAMRSWMRGQNSLPGQDERTFRREAEDEEGWVGATAVTMNVLTEALGDLRDAMNDGDTDATVFAIKQMSDELDHARNGILDRIELLEARRQRKEIRGEA